MPSAPSLRSPELLLPAGGFESAIAAFEGGADAIYLGFSDFSARKQARNFDRLEYRRMLGHAHSTGKRIYVALNTIVAEGEFEGLVELLVFLSRFKPDAVIFQDWGLASLIHEEFPGIELHASTQTAIQTPEAARLAASCGVTRIVPAAGNAASRSSGASGARLRSWSTRSSSMAPCATPSRASAWPRASSLAVRATGGNAPRFAVPTTNAMPLTERVLPARDTGSPAMTSASWRTCPPSWLPEPPR